MKLAELKECIDRSIEECQRIIYTHPLAVLSEADFERLLSSQISIRIGEDINQIPNPDDFSVHNQISHYFEKDGKARIDSRVDVLILKEKELKENGINHKEFRYDKDSFVLELKYLHNNDSVQKVECDFCKWKYLKKESWMYIVVLIDSFNDKDFKEKETQIMEMREKALNENRETENNNLFCAVIRKEI